MMINQNLIWKCLANIDFCFEYLHKHKSDTEDETLLFILSRLICTDFNNSNLLNIYDLPFLYKFSPSKHVCSKLFEYKPHNIHVLKCCIIYGYNDLYFLNFSCFDLELYKFALMSNNVEVLNHQISICDNLDLLRPNLDFDYSIYLPIYLNQ